VDAAETDGQLFLIRVAQNRMTVDNRQVLDAIGKTHCMGKAAITIPRDSRRNLEEREGILQIRYSRYEITRPAILDKNKALKDSVEVCVIHAKEEHPPKGVAPIEWCLMTNESVETIEAAYEKCFTTYHDERYRGFITY
jgi:hypothetical protein